MADINPPITVGTTSTAVLAASVSRLEAELVNTSPYSVIYVMVGAAAVVGQGVRLNPNGGRWRTASRLAINAIAAAVTQPNGSAATATLTGSTSP